MKAKVRLLVALIVGMGLVAGVVATAVYGQETVKFGGGEILDVSNQVGGLVGGVDQAGNFAYIGYGAQIHVLNIQNPASPVVVGKSEPLPGVVTDVVLVGNRLVVGAGLSVVVLDVSDPAVPTILGIHSTPGVAIRLVVSGNLVYVAEAQFFNEVTLVGGGLRIVDISDPATPLELGYLDVVGGVFDVAVFGNYAYIGGRFSNVNQIWVVDVTNPAMPTMVTNRGAPAIPRGIITDGSYLYVAVISSGVDVFDISNPASPNFVIRMDTPGNAWALDLQGNMLYVSDAAGGMHYVDVSNPASPSIQDTYFVSGAQTINVIAGNSHTYIAYGGAGLHITELNNANQIGVYEEPIGAADIIAIDSDMAMVLEEFRGVHILDITDGINPVKVGFYTTTNFYNTMQLVGNTGYIMGSTAGLTRLDLSVPGSPTFIDNYSSVGTKNSFFVKGNYAYLTNSAIGLEIVDLLTSPPTYVGEVNVGGGGRQLEVVGNYAYIAGNSLHIVDVSNPMAPTLATSYPVTGSARAIGIQGSYAYVGGFESGLTVVDISNPNAPDAVAYFPLNLDFEEIQMAGNFVYVAGGEQKDAAVIDISNPLQPTLFGRYPTSGPFNQTDSVAVKEGEFYAAAWLGGLYVLSGPADLKAANDGPTALGQTTNFSATIFVTETVTFNWDFGDGMSGTGANPSHMYAAPGVYTAVVTGQYGTVTQTAETTVLVEETVSGLTASNDGPTVLGNPTNFMASISAGTNVTYSWDFGDGTSGVGANQNHTYAAPGMYTAVVNASNAVSFQTAETTVFVDVLISGLSASNDGPTPFGSPTTLIASTTAGSNVTYSWDFGDGTTGNGPVVMHTYGDVGVYTAVVTATNSVSVQVATTTVVVKGVVYMPAVVGKP